MQIIESLEQALFMAFSMFWEILWPLILGFTLSGIVQAVVSHQSIAKALGGDTPKHLAIATLFGIASSSCSYAAVALARSIFQKGASFTAAMVFQLASTNLVIELGIILIVLMGWQFMAAEYLGGLLMVIFLAVIFRLTLTPRLVQEARSQAEKGVMGRMEGHAAMDMSVSGGSFWNKLFSGKGLTSVSSYFVMDWASVWVDIALGLLIAGALAAWVPDSFWQAFFLSNNPTLAKIEGPLMGPLVAMVSFVCSVGNVPLAAVLWRGGISFGGVVSFIFADLIILPILDIYRKYYGWKMMSYILVTFYITMAAAGYVVEFLFAALGIIPQNRNVVAITDGIHWNYTSVLNIIFLALAALLVIRFFRTGGLAMLKMMNRSEQQMDHHGNEQHEMHHQNMS
ncbi:permease [Dictyobacter formicarum]|uniref:Membrane protein n=1 Tax=Dictyobacter formicarum TaxID=2778368 RepID=A0ABQ3VEX0_9CHLR|nr:permease [Dictyobacter formicarum]GHO84041.1 membrane protein [Dictyobacter formicarum]